MSCRRATQVHAVFCSVPERQSTTVAILLPVRSWTPGTAHYKTWHLLNTIRQSLISRVIIMAHFALCTASRNAHSKQYYLDMTRINYPVYYTLRNSLKLLTTSRSDWSTIIANLLKYVLRNSKSYGRVALNISELLVLPKRLWLATGTSHAISQKGAMFSAVQFVFTNRVPGKKFETKNLEETRR